MTLCTVLSFPSFLTSMFTASIDIVTNTLRSIRRCTVSIITRFVTVASIFKSPFAIWVLKKKTKCHFFHLELYSRKERNALVNDALNTFYLRLYGVGHTINDAIT